MHNKNFLKSKAIIEYCEKSGAFTSVDDLAKSKRNRSANNQAAA